MATATSAGPGVRGRSVDWASVLKESLLAGGLAFLLTVVIVGLRATDAPGGLRIVTRWEEVAVAVILVFLGRLGLALTREGLALPVLIGSLAVAVAGWLLNMPSEVLTVIAVGGGLVTALRAAWSMWRHRGALPDREKREKAMDRLGARVQRASIYIGPLVVLFAIALPFLPFADRTTIDTGTLILTYVMLGWGLNIIVGLAGLLDLGYVAFYAIGAYSFALIATTFGWSFWACLPLAGLFAAFGGLILGFPVLRLRGDYFAIVTLGFGEIIRVVLLNWYQFTGGPDGILGIPEPSFFGLAEFTRRPGEGEVAFHELFGLEYSTLQEMTFLYYLILVMALAVNFFTMRIRRLPIGRSWEALREDDIACQSLGINRRNIKLAAFMISAMFGGFAGSFFATRQGFISPESFSFIESAIILAIVVLGGMGSQAGVALAAILLIGLPEIFRDLAQYRMLAFGAAMVLIMIWRPQGLLAHREPTVRLHDPKTGRRTLIGAEGRYGAPAQ
jgi:branched-chain amino acid transport system permease protein